MKPGDTVVATSTIHVVLLDGGKPVPMAEQGERLILLSLEGNIATVHPMGEPGAYFRCSADQIRPL